MNKWTLPKSVEIDGKEYEINTDYRDILEIISILQDNKYGDTIKLNAVLEIFYSKDIPSNLEQAVNKMMLFMNCNEEESKDNIYRPKLIDFDQDYQEIVSGINKVAGYEIRAVKYLHWFTFISLFKEIGEGQLSFIVNIRNKLAKGKKLEKNEQEFYAQNKEKIKLKEKLSLEEQEEEDRINEIFR